MMNLKEYENKIINADCLDFLRKLPDKCVDLVLTDPPYFKIVKNEWDNQWKDIFEFQAWCGRVADDLKRVMKDNASLYWFGDDKRVAYVQTELDKRFNLLNCIVWRKKNMQTVKGVNVFRSFAPITERILFYDKGEDKSGLEMVKKVMPNPFAVYLKSELLRKFGTIAQIRKFVINELKFDGAMVNRWFEGDSVITKETWNLVKEKLGGDYLKREYEDLRREYESLRRPWNADRMALDVLDFPFCQDKGRFHPTQKPLSLISYLIERSSNPGAIVLDPFSGSGTTAVAAHNLGRRFVCIEKDRGYWEASVKRLEDARKQISIFELPQNKNLNTEGIK